jgi:hypothetical protein
MNSGSVYTSRWGLRGTEDLGGGLSAVSDSENGFNSTNGTFKNGGDLFGHQVAVSRNCTISGPICGGISCSVRSMCAMLSAICGDDVKAPTRAAMRRTSCPVSSIASPRYAPSCVRAGSDKRGSVPSCAA